MCIHQCATHLKNIETNINMTVIQCKNKSLKLQINGSSEFPKNFEASVYMHYSTWKHPFPTLLQGTCMATWLWSRPWFHMLQTLALESRGMMEHHSLPLHLSIPGTNLSSWKTVIPFRNTPVLFLQGCSIHSHHLHACSPFPSSSLFPFQ